MRTDLLIFLAFALLAASCSSRGGTASSVPPGPDPTADAAAVSDVLARDTGQQRLDGTMASEVGSVPAAVCPGTPPTDGQKLCRKQEDCGSPAFWRCAFESMQPAGCGACNHPTVECSTDEQCRGDGGAPDRICVPRDLPCSCTGQPSFACAPGCTATSCGSGARCNARSRCELIPCTEGHDCGPTNLCAPTRAGAYPNGCVPKSCKLDGFACGAGMECLATGGDLHGCGPLRCDHGGAPCPVNSVCDPAAGGCRTKACTRDGDCDCGACIGGTCYARLFICSPLGSP
jgi:hypothetical protein